jgi:hypothetical protein
MIELLQYDLLTDDPTGRPSTVANRPCQYCSLHTSA